MKGKGFIPTMVDLRNSYLVSHSGEVSIPTTYGERERTYSNEDSQKLSLFLDFALKGYDQDLQLVRMGKRYYSPELGSFTTADPLFLENPEKCVESPIECNLYSYAGNNPINKVDPSGLFEISADFNGNRNNSTMATIKDDFGNVMYSVPALGRGESRNQWVENGDTPTGHYRLEKAEIGGNWNKISYGDAKIHLEPLSGVAKDSNRTLLRIHGGQSGSEKHGDSYNTNPYTSGRSNLKPTWGCLRMSNADVVRVANTLNDYRSYRNTFKYIVDQSFYEVIGRTTNANDSLYVR